MLCSSPHFPHQGVRVKFHFLRLDSPSGPRPISCGSKITLRHITLPRPLSDNTHSTHNRQTSISPAGLGFESRWRVWMSCLSQRAAADPRLRPRGHWDRKFSFITPLFPTVRLQQSVRHHLQRDLVLKIRWAQQTDNHCSISLLPMRRI